MLPLLSTSTSVLSLVLPPLSTSTSLLSLVLLLFWCCYFSSQLTSPYVYIRFFTLPTFGFFLRRVQRRQSKRVYAPLERNAPQPLKTDVELWLPDPPSCAKLGIIAVFGRSRTRVLFSMFEVGWWKTPGVDASRSVCKLCGRANKRQR